MDRFGRGVLTTFAQNGRFSITELAQRIRLSKSPTYAPLRQLEHSGVIKGYGALLDSIQLGLDYVAFVEVRLSDTREAALAAFNAAVMLISEIEQAHLIAGNFDYLMKIRTRSMANYRRVLAENISSPPHVANTSTYVAMQAVKEDVLGHLA